MDDIGLLDNQVTIKLAGKDYPIDFTMASIYYLIQKHGDVGALFSSLRGGVDSKSIEVISDLVYAGMIVCDDDDNLKAPMTAKKIMSKIHFGDLADITEAVTKAFASAFPDAKKNPTKGVKAPKKAKDGIGDTSIPSEPLN